MARETDTSAGAETDNAHPQDTDTSTEWDYFDPEEDTEEDSADEETDDEAEAETEAETEDETEDEAEDEADEDADEHSDEKKPELVKLHDGTEVTFEELTKGYLRQADYTRKQQEVSNERKSVSANAERIERITSAFTDFLVSAMPKEPDISLAHSDPSKYTAQRATYDAALSKVQELFQLAEQPGKVRQDMSKEDHEKLKTSEWNKLTEALPNTATREGKESFFKEIQSVVSEVGFTPDDMGKVIDHRLFLLADLAKDGLAARQAKTKAKEKARKAPPAAPNKPGQSAKKANRNAEAMRKLNRSGSIHDALAVDFD